MVMVVSPVVTTMGRMSLMLGGSRTRFRLSLIAVVLRGRLELGFRGQGDLRYLEKLRCVPSSMVLLPVRYLRICDIRFKERLRASKTQGIIVCLVISL